MRSGSLGVKRPLEDDVKSDLANKKARGGGGVRPRVNVKKVAEIVIVLATIGKMRAGRKPTPVEIKMMTEATEKLSEICKEFAPKDVFPKYAFGAIIKDLGLNRSSETKLGIRPPKLSISEKLQLAEQKMEKSEVFPLHSDKADHDAPILSSRFQNHSTVYHASSVFTSSHLERHSTESLVQRDGRSHLRSDERSNANSTGNHRAPNTHKEISKIVKKTLQPPHITELQKWTPPSRDYMNKPLTCQTCKTIVNEVDTTLICDSCEKGYHLKCVNHIPKSISRVKWQEWHCAKCSSTTNGKPFPPKYGPVLRNINTPKTCSIDAKDQETETAINSKGNIVKTSGTCEWVGGVVNEADGKTNYSSCCINGNVYKLQDYALVASNGSVFAPNKLHEMWEDNKTREKWITVTRCFFPDDLPEGVGHPCAPESNEVYESNHERVLEAWLIHGPCEVAPPCKFADEKVMQTRSSDTPKPLFLCKWFYDEKKQLFRDVAC